MPELRNIPIGEPIECGQSEGDRFKVSVVVPVFNTAEYLPECLDSLTGQTLDSVQIIIVNDGSTDSSALIAERYANNNPESIVYLQQDNSGQGAARNLALRYCEGEYVGFMDSDDFADIRMYELMYEKAKASNADMCVCGIVSFCSQDGKRVYDTSAQLPEEPATQKGLFLSPQTQPPIRLIRREVLEKNSIRYPETRGSEDNGFHFKVAPYCHSIVAVKLPMVKRRIRSFSTASNISASFCDQFFSVADDAIGFYSENGLIGDYGELLEAALVRMLLCSRLGCIGLVDDKKARKTLTKKTAVFIEKQFPHRGRNRYLSGITGMYLKHAGYSAIVLFRGYFSLRYRKKMHLSN